MIQDIEPKRLLNEYRPSDPKDTGRCLVFRDRQVLIKEEAGQVFLPEYGEITERVIERIYLFRIDEQEYYLTTLSGGDSIEGYTFENLQTVRRLRPKSELFAVMTGYHLYVWYRDNRYCGRCASPVAANETQRSLLCPNCGNMIFPKISPAVIVAVTDGDRLLMTRYNGRTYKGYALIAGFTEIGETAEQTVAREVLEEVGLRVKNIRYYGSQPWGMECDLLLGFSAELDCADDICLDAEELSMAGWYRKEEIDYVPDDVSLTNDMIRAFLEGRLG